VKNIIKKILREETFNGLFQVKNVWVELSKDDRSKLKHNMWNLVNNSYKVFPKGHPRVTNVGDVYKDSEMAFWRASDHDNDPDADMVVFGRETPYGVKISGVGHDGEILSKKEVMRQCANLLRQQGFFIEASGAVSKILLQMYKCPTVDNIGDVQDVLDMPIKKWVGKIEGEPGDGWYIRDVDYNKNSRNYLTKILIGKPNI
tara:strand:- start:261 stop:866 length:606 start_codon:yes stop_codon:yes gene_type:complete